MGYKSDRSKACDISAQVKHEVWERDGHKCIVCGNTNASPNAHYISRARGGLGTPENIVTLCLKCHTAFDSGVNGEQESYRMYIESYLRRLYPGWNPIKMVYRKGGQCE